MIIQTNDQNQFTQKAWRIRRQVSKILTKWGLLPRFKRWRLTQDPDTGMVVLFGILNNKYIAAHTPIPFNNYFDPRLLHDLANELQVQVVSCNSNGLRYAFILDRGSSPGKLPTHIDFPFLDGNKLFVRVVYDDKPLPEAMEPQIIPVPIVATGIDDQALVRQGVGAFLKVFDDIKLRDDDALKLAAKNPPEVVIINEDEFNERLAAEHAANRRSGKRIRI